MNNKILITGGSGSLGSNFSFGKKISSKDCDLTDPIATEKLFKDGGFDQVYHASAIVGGLGYHLDPNSKYDLYYKNLMINANVLHFAQKYKVKKILSYLSSCIYSDNCPSPYTEKMIFDGPPSPVHFSYAHAKKNLLVQSQILHDLGSIKAICVIPVNLFGINDNYNYEHGHFLASLIRRAFECSKNGEDFIVWGDGLQTRNLLFMEDMVNISNWLMENYSDREPIIVCDNISYEIGFIAKLISEKFGIQKQLKFDTSKPVGQKNRILSGDKLASIYKYNFTPIEIALDKTISWFLNNYPNIRL